MARTVWLGAILALGLSCAAAGAPADGAQVVPLYSSDARSLVMLRVGERPPAPVVFDTGAFDNILDTAFARQLGLSRTGPSEIIDAATGKPVEGFAAMLPAATVGGAAVGPRVQIIDFPERDAVGIFGPNSFAGRLVMLELGQGRLRIAPRTEAWTPTEAATPYAGEGGEALPGIPVALPGGKVVIAHLDTGSTGALTLPLALARGLPMHAPPVVVGRAVSVSGEQDVYGGRLKGEVRIGGLVLRDPEVEFLDGDVTNVGLRVARRLSMVLDPEKRVSWVLAPPSLAPADLAAYAGRYGERSVRVEGEGLVFQRDGQPPWALKPAGVDLFDLGDTGVQVRFLRTAGKVDRFVQLLPDGGVAPSARTG